jgi:exopolyphosphatase / guanosine-5'-triphosphate,3'-diphosphate pyrophosphatase
MVCACVDIGTNTTRVLVADVKGGRLTEVLQRRAFTRIGTQAEIPREKIEEVARVVAEQVALAGEAGAQRVRIVATACIRAAVNRDEFLAGMTEPVEILDGDEEARLAFLGATQTLGSELPGVVGVVDVGGGSTEIAVGTPLLGPAWVASIDLGSLRLTQMCIEGDPPPEASVRTATDAARHAFAPHSPPRPDAVFASGGSARAAGKLVGREVGTEDLEGIVRMAMRWPADKLARTFRLHPHRGRTLLAGALLLREATHVLGRPLTVAAAGMREGAAFALAEAPQAARAA